MLICAIKRFDSTCFYFNTTILIISSLTFFLLSTMNFSGSFFITNNDSTFLANFIRQIGILCLTLFEYNWDLTINIFSSITLVSTALILRRRMLDNKSLLFLSLQKGGQFLQLSSSQKNQIQTVLRYDQPLQRKD